MMIVPADWKHGLPDVGHNNRFRKVESDSLQIKLISYESIYTFNKNNKIRN